MLEFFWKLGSWIESHPGTAAWAQAIGSVVAVVVAIYVPMQLAKADRRSRENDREIIERGRAILLAPFFGRLHSGVRQASNALRVIAQTSPPQSFSNLHEVIGLREFREEVWANAEKYRPETLRPIQNMVYHVTSYNTAVRTYKQSAAANNLVVSEAILMLNELIQKCFASTAIVQARLGDVSAYQELSGG